MVTINKQVRFLLLVCFALAILYFLVYSRQPDDYDYKTLQVGETKIRVFVADEDRERILGLSGKNELMPDEGMFFVFQVEGVYKFWMRDMNFPIDMIWLDKDMKIVYIQENATPESYPESFGPDMLTSYVLEVGAYFARENNLEIGDQAFLIEE